MKEKQREVLLKRNSYLDHAKVAFIGSVYFLDKLIEVFEFLHGGPEDRAFLNFHLNSFKKNERAKPRLRTLLRQKEYLGLSAMNNNKRNRSNFIRSFPFKALQ